MAGLSELDRRQMTHWRPGRGDVSPELLAREAAAQREQALYAQPTDPTVAGVQVSNYLPPHLRPAWRGMGILGEMLAPSAMKENPGAVGAMTDVASSVPITKGILAMAALPGSIKGIRALERPTYIDPSNIGWHFKDVAYPHNLMEKGDWARVSRALDAEDWIEAEIPIRSMNATQSRVNDDFASVAGGQLPFVIKKNGQFFVQDGHHRITAAAAKGNQTAKVRLVDLDNTTQTEFPLLDYKRPTGGDQP